MGKPVKKLMMGALLVAFSSGTHAEDLFCQGNTYIHGEEVPATRVLSFDSKTLEISVMTNAGRVSGIAEARPEVYLGRLRRDDGLTYWFNFHRYTGELSLVPMPAENKYGTTDFTGICKRAERKF